MEILRDHFQTQLKRIRKVLYWADGFEVWIQIEVMVAGWEAGYLVTTKGKKEHDSDLVIYSPSGTIGIEIKHWRWGMGDTLTSAFKQHPGADYYIFLNELPCQYFEKAKEKVANCKTLHVWKYPHDGDWYISLLSKQEGFKKIELG